MKLAVFFPASLFSAWACSYGLVDCLRRMGHEVTAVPIDPAKPNVVGITGIASGVDALIISGPEHIGKFVADAQLAWRVPAVAWLHETVEREDYGKLDVDAIKRCVDVIFCPAVQDEKYGFRYLPFGVDTEIFAPVNVVPTKSIDAGFIGLLYPKRQAFLAELKKYGVNLVTGNVQVLELGGVNPRKTAELYAENIRKIKVFVNLPTLSQLAVTKIYEVLACGTPILTPEVSDMRNLQGLPIIPYRDAAEVARILKTESIATAYDSAPDMLANHRLELRCERLISALKEAGAKAA